MPEERKLSSSLRVRIWLSRRVNFSFTYEKFLFSMDSCLFRICRPRIHTTLRHCRLAIARSHGFSTQAIEEPNTKILQSHSPIQQKETYLSADCRLSHTYGFDRVSPGGCSSTRICLSLPFDNSSHSWATRPWTLSEYFLCLCANSVLSRHRLVLAICMCPKPLGLLVFFSLLHDGSVGYVFLCP